MSKIEYFFECYFNMSANYYEIEDLVSEYLSIESKDFIINITNELKDIVRRNNWNSIIRIGRDKGGRILNTNKAEELTQYLLVLFQEKDNIRKPDFCKDY